MKKVLIALSVALFAFTLYAGEKLTYKDFKSSKVCKGCHRTIMKEYQRSLMSQTFTHGWDEAEYYNLALPHAEKLPKVAEVKAGCNGCHAPVAFLVGDIPPKRPSEGSRANDSLSCDLCHSITGFKGDTPFNFNYLVKPGKVKQGPRGTGKTGYHQITKNPFLKSAEFCGICHNEKDPYGIWVKSTHLEWKESPYSKAGIVCQDCHMPPAKGKSASMGPNHADMRQHLFNGAHDVQKLHGSVEVRLYASKNRVTPGSTLTLDAVVMNAKAGHMIPSGSAEEREVWLHVEAVDAKGKVYHLPVDPKGFKGEEYLIADPKALAYQDLGEIQGIKGFKGLPRDGDAAAGDRIFRLPYFDPDGRMTIAQWHTASLGVDYRLAPLKATRETFTWEVPESLPAGPVTFRASVYYSRLVSSVAKFMKIPKEEYQSVLVNKDTVMLNVK